jgi:hypothetical protein
MNLILLLTVEDKDVITIGIDKFFSSDLAAVTALGVF